VAAALRIAWLAIAVALPAGAQHPLPPRDRTLAERLALSDAVVLGRVVLVEPGRLHLEDARALRGEVAAELTVKRSPTAPPPYEEGDLAVFFLRGARPPYVLADAPREMIRPADEAGARELAKAVGDLVAADGDAQRILALHASWLEGSDDALRELGAAGLAGPLPADFARERALVAMDAARPRAVRSASAGVAVGDAGALALLVAWVPGAASDEDAVVSDVVLRRAASLQAPNTEEAVLRAIASPNRAVRRAGVAGAAGLRENAGDRLRQEIAALAAGDPDPELRVEAQRAARRIGLR
jgi:hypothetical protein